MVKSSHHLHRAMWFSSFAVLALVLIAGWGNRSAVIAEPLNDENLIFMPYVGKPRPPQFELAPFVAGFDGKTITAIKHAGDSRLFIAGREGKIWVVYPDGRINETPFLDISKQVAFDQNFEQGLLGLAFHPDYPRQPYFYIAYTTFGAIHIVRGEVSPPNSDVASPQSLRLMIGIAKPPATGGPSPVHNAGDLTFGPDGYLYIPLGDGGPDPYDPLGVPGDPFNNSQRRDTPLGSILRIDPDPDRGLPPDCGVSNIYSIPPDNPFIGDAGCDEIWATGLRNPWRISIDPLNGDLYIADVGEWKREEVNYYPGNAPGGANFGWHCWEGTVDYTKIHPELAGNCSPDTTYVFPVHEYDHSGGECSIIGGLIYRGQKYPALNGRYFFGDWCTGRLWTMIRDGGNWQVDLAGRTLVPYSTFGTDINGELYAAGYANGTLYKMTVR